MAAEGQTPLGWRRVPVDEREAGTTARAVAPAIEQLFIGMDDSLTDELAIERKLYVIRRLIEKTAVEDVHVASMSSRTMVYKGMLIAHQLAPFFADLRDERTASALALVHSRFSTNTFPSWPLAHPYRFIAHNGEINTLMGNSELDARARGRAAVGAVRRRPREARCRSSSRATRTRPPSTTWSSCCSSRGARSRTR